MHLTITVFIIISAKAMAFKPDHVPVFILIDGPHDSTEGKEDAKTQDKNDNIEGNPFGRLDQPDFSKNIRAHINQIDPKVIIVFLERDLSTEDLSIKDETGSTYSFLEESQKLGKVRYLPAVCKAAQALGEIYKPYRTVTLSTLNDIKEHNFNENVYVNFGDVTNETRTQSLRRHDSIMREVVNVAKGAVDGSVFAIYTGINNPVKYDDFDFKPKRVPEKAVVIPTHGALFKFYGMYSSARTRRFTELPSVPQPFKSLNHLSTYMEYPEFGLRFNFTFFTDRWQLDTVSLVESDEEVGHRKMYVGAPWRCSFVCGEPLTIFNLRDGSHISIPYYQIQPFRRSNKTAGNWRLTPPEEQSEKPNQEGDLPSTEKPEQEGNPDDPAKDDNSDQNDTDPGEFGEAVHCGKYFSASILSCLFVVSILIGILGFGITILMDCKTGSRFDDSQGKQLIVAQDAGSK